MQPRQNRPVRGYCCPACGKASEIYREPNPSRKYSSSDLLTVAVFGWLGYLSVVPADRSRLHCGGCGKRFMRPLGGAGFLIQWLVLTVIVIFIAYVTAAAFLKGAPAGVGMLSGAAREIARNPEAVLVAFAAAFLTTCITIIAHAGSRARERMITWRIRYAQEKAVEKTSFAPEGSLA